MTPMVQSADPFGFEFEQGVPRSIGGPLEARIRELENQVTTLRRELAESRNLLAYAYRNLDEAHRAIQISQQLTTASLTETRDLCLPHVTKSLLYATVETLDATREEGGLPDEYLRVRKRTIEQLERFDAKGVLTLQEQHQKQEAIKRNQVLVRFADIMTPRKLLGVDEAVELLSSKDPSGPRIVIDGTQAQPDGPSARMEP